MGFRQDLFLKKGYKVSIECSKGIYSSTLGIAGERRKLCLKIDYLGPAHDTEVSEVNVRDRSAMLKIASPWKGEWNERAISNFHRDDNDGIWTDYISVICIKNDRLQQEKLVLKYTVPQQLAGIGAVMKVTVEDELVMTRELKDAGQYEEIIDISNVAQYLVSYLERSHKLEAILLKEFIRVCSKYDINYYLFCGSALGAVRNGDFIEWDDDIDVALTRKDFNRLMAVCGAEWGDSDDFCVITPRNISDSYFVDFMTRLVYLKEETPTSVLTRIEGHIDENLLHKETLDMFILENGTDNDLLHKIQTNLIKGLYGLALGHRKEFDPDSYVQQHENRNIRIATRLVSIGKKIPLPLILKCYDWVCGWFADSRGKYCFQSNGYINCMNWRFSREWFGDGTDGRLGDIKVRLPADYDKYLTRQYGNYMELPGGFSRSPAHWDTR